MVPPRAVTRRAQAFEPLAIPREVDPEHELGPTAAECASDRSVKSIQADLLLHAAPTAGALQDPAVLMALSLIRIRDLERGTVIDAERDGASASSHSRAAWHRVVPVPPEERLSDVRAARAVVDVDVE